MVPAIDVFGFPVIIKNYYYLFGFRLYEMSNQWFHIIVSKHIIVKEKENKIIKTNHFTVIWWIVKEAFKKEYFNFQEN